MSGCYCSVYNLAKSRLLSSVDVGLVTSLKTQFILFKPGQKMLPNLRPEVSVLVSTPGVGVRQICNKDYSKILEECSVKSLF